MNESPPLLGIHLPGRLLSGALLCVSLLFSTVAAHADTLAEAWLVKQAQLHHPIDWPYSMALREKDVAELTRRHTRALEALDAVAKIKHEPWQTRWHTELATPPPRRASSQPGTLRPALSAGRPTAQHGPCQPAACGFLPGARLG